MLATIEEVEQRRKAITDGYAAPGFFERTTASEVEKLARQDEQLGAQIDALVAEWEAIETELAENAE